MNLDEIGKYDARVLVKKKLSLEPNIQNVHVLKKLLATDDWAVVDISKKGKYLDGITKNMKYSRRPPFESYHLPFGRNHALYREEFDIYSKLNMRKMSAVDRKRHNEQQEFIRYRKCGDFALDFHELTKDWRTKDKYKTKVILVGVDWEITGALDGMTDNQDIDQEHTHVYFWSPKPTDLPLYYDWIKNGKCPV